MADHDAGQLWTVARMQERLVRYADLVPCRNAFIDTRTPGSEAKENFTIIGPGVSENPEQHVHIAEPHGFNIGAARQPPHCVNSQHSHDTAEVFVIHSGDWTFNFGETGTDHRIAAGPGAVASVPTGLFRGFSNVGSDIGFLWVALGGDDPGRVRWAPYVFDMARDYGLVLLEDGSLVDTAQGQPIPEGARPMPRTTPEQVAAMKRPSEAELRGCIVAGDEFDAQPAGPLSGAGVDERLVIAPEAKLSWAHPFTLSRALFTPGGETTSHTHHAPEVLFVHRGGLQVVWDAGELAMGEGDTLTLPVGLSRRLLSDEGAVVFIVRGTEGTRAGN
jgi:mannose-6-phosphate isomerase-like protein (cupin superfamily)